MLSPRSFHDIKDKIGRNDEKINLLQMINTVLKESHEIESNYKSLSLKFTKMQKEETERREQYDHTRKAYLVELENKGADLCKEQTKYLHQVEHLQWHMEGCAKHKPCHSYLTETNIKKHTTTSTVSCPSQSSATGNSVCRPSYMANLRNTSERLIKHIIDLRKKIYIVEQKLEHEIKRKREMEKRLSDMRKDISRQKKLLTMRRTTPVPSSLPPLKKTVPVK